MFFVLYFCQILTLYTFDDSSKTMGYKREYLDWIDLTA